MEELNIPKEEMEWNPALKIDWLNPKVKQCTDKFSDLPDVITPDYGIGITFKDDAGVEYTTVCNCKREIRVRASSFKGISFWAVHYYGHIIVYEPSLKYIEDGEEKISSIGGAFDRFKPAEAKTIEIDPQRPLTEKDMNEGTEWDEKRWDGGTYRVGSLVNAYESQVELYNAMVDLIKARFAGDWLVSFDDFDSQAYNIYPSIPLPELKYYGE